MRVAHVLAGGASPDVANGVRKYVYFMARAQAALGLDVAAVGLGREAGPAIPGVRVRVFPPSRVPFRVPRALRAELEAWGPDLVHLHSPYYPPNAALGRWARRVRIPYVVTPHGALSPGEIRQRWPLKLPYKFLFERPLLNRAAFVHAVGAAENLERYGVTAPIRLAPGGVDLESVPRDLDRTALAAREPVLAGRRVFLFLGRLDPPQKGLDLLVRAFAAARLEGAALVIAGPDYRGGRRRMARLVAGIRPASPVLLLGPVYGRDRWTVVAGADVFVNTARWEGMPIAVLEAAAVEAPCLLTRVADPLGRLARAGAALEVEPDVAAIAAGLRRMHAASAAELRRMGECAREVVAAEFSWERGARILAEEYARARRVPDEPDPRPAAAPTRPSAP